MMKAIIETGSKQYMVQKGDTLEVELVGADKSLNFEPLMIVDGKDTKVGTPTVSGAKVTAKVLEPNKKSDKVTIMKFQAKKRVHKKTGHRQPVSVIEITNISAK